MDRLGCSALIFVLAAACTSEPSLPIAELRDPETCKTCHPDHYAEWARSMHAYAADDPVFIAMNARGQRETNGELGDFCVKCHAPLALALGATSDGLNLASLPASQRGVTCIFCHNIDGVTGDRNAAVHYADDGIMRGGIDDPAPTDAHRAQYSRWHDRERDESSELCGACHDIENKHGVHLERTLSEWRTSVFATTTFAQSCSNCHMTGRRAVAAKGDRVSGVKLRTVHSHAFPGVDVALTPWSEPQLARAEIESELAGTILAQLCYETTPFNRIHVTLDNVGAGHHWPSGATQDRRAWVELVAYSGSEVIYQSGVVADGTPPVGMIDPDYWLIRDCMFDGAGNEVHMFWEAESTIGNALPVATTLDPMDPAYLRTHVHRAFPDDGILQRVPDRITMRVRVQPIGLDVLDDLIASGDLEASVRSAMPVIDLPTTVLEWTEATAVELPTDNRDLRVICVSNSPSRSLVVTATRAASHAECVSRPRRN